MRWSIRYRLLVPQVLILLALLGGTTYIALRSAQHAEMRIAEQLQRVANTLTDSSFPLTRSVLEQMKGLSGAEFALERPPGLTISTFDIQGIPLPILSPTAPDQLGPSIVVGSKTYRVRRVPMTARSDQPGGVLTIFYPDALVRDAVSDAVRPSLLIGLLGGGIAITLLIGLGEYLVKRIREVERRTRILASGDFSPMPLPQQNDELQDLSRSVNEMANQLARLQQAERESERLRLIGQLSSGLAHQLRNGVTGARLAVQVHAQDCPLTEDDALNVVLRQLALMESNLRRFLDLGQTDGWRRERCDLRDPIDEGIALLRPQCRHASIALEWQRPDVPLIVLGDRAQLGHLLLNVLSNAVEAAGPNGTVEVIACTQSGFHCIEIWDSGPGPSDALAARLFEPFVTGKPEGIGLGLSVARQAAESHGGRIDWQRDGTRTLFRIELPQIEV